MTRLANVQPVIDAHVHIHPDAVWRLVEIMDANSLSQVVNLGILERLGIPFDEGMRAFRKFAGDRLAYFPSPDFRDNAAGFGERMAQELERKVEGGARGLKIFKELGLSHRDAAGMLIPVDDERLDPLWAMAGKLGVPVLIHTADPIAFFRPLDDNNELRSELERRPEWHFFGPGYPALETLLDQRNRVLERHRGTDFIGAHMGSYAEDLTRVDAWLDSHSNFHVDTSARVGFIGRHPPEQARAFFIKHQDRVIFGTDLILGWPPYSDGDPGDLAEYQRDYDEHRRFFATNERQVSYPDFPRSGGWRVDALGLPPDVLSKLYSGNIQGLLARRKDG